MPFSRLTVATVMIAAIGGGAAIGIGSAGPAAVAEPARAAGAALGVFRARPPQPGDRWPGCNDARSAGTAPIYRGEPGYDARMDGDADGIACEPIRG
jgi:hypothetical protein